MEVLLNGEIKEAKVIGSYGLFDNPVVELEGHKYVAEPVFVNDNLEILSSRCQSNGCFFCEGKSDSCRNGIFKDCHVVNAV